MINRYIIQKREIFSQELDSKKRYISIIINFINSLKYIMNQNTDTMENDWLYEFQNYIKKFALLIILLLIILLVILII